MLTLLMLAWNVVADPTPAPSSWPSFRGDGTSVTTAASLPVTWSPMHNLSWRTELPGYGQSSPVIWGNSVYVTAIEGPEKERLLVLAVDLGSGKIIWTKEFAASQKAKNNPMMSRAAPTPVVDRQGVYAFFESGDVIALTHHGEVRWQRSLTRDYGEFKNNHGLGSSPAQTDTAVVILIDHFGPSYLVALDKSTGKDLWKVDRPSRVSWTSPTIARLHDRPVVVVSSSGAVSVYDAVTGRPLVQQEGFVGNNIPSATIENDLIVVGAGENRMKPDAAATAKSNSCWQLNLRDGQATLQPLWQGVRVVCHHASPVVHRGYAYFVSKTGFVHCVDLRTGKECYAERLQNPCWATPIAAGEYVYFFGKDGVTTVLKAGPNYQRVAVNRLWSAEEFERRQAEARKQAEAILPPPPQGKGPGGGPPVPKEELEALRYSAVGDVVYGVAVADKSFVIRTGTELFRVRESEGRK